MATRRRIVLYGNSMVIGAVGASLEHIGRFELILLPLPVSSTAELDALAPDVIVFDVENSHPRPAFALLETRPGLLLLGISPEGDLVRLWSRRQWHAPSTHDLTALIEGVTSVLDESQLSPIAAGAKA